MLKKSLLLHLLQPQATCWKVPIPEPSFLHLIHQRKLVSKRLLTVCIEELKKTKFLLLSGEKPCWHVQSGQRWAVRLPGGWQSVSSVLQRPDAFLSGSFDSFFLPFLLVLLRREPVPPVYGPPDSVIVIKVKFLFL